MVSLCLLLILKSVRSKLECNKYIDMMTKILTKRGDENKEIIIASPMRAMDTPVNGSLTQVGGIPG